MKKTNSEIKPIKNGKRHGTTYCFGCKDCTQNVRPEKVKMTNKVLREKSQCYLTIKWVRLFKTKTQHQKIIQIFTDWCYKNKMKTCCMKCRKETENINPKMFRTKNSRLIMQLKRLLCGIKKLIFVKEQDAKVLLSNLGIKTLLSKIPLLNVLF